jgi:hypothetical protein
VDRKVKPVPGVYPEDARTIRTFPEDPLSSLPILSPNPPSSTPAEKLSLERLQLLEVNSEGFLWPEEEKPFDHIMQVHQHTRAFEETDRGTFREDYSSPHIIPTVPHVPWAERKIPVPPGILNDVVKLLKDKIAAGVYEPGQSSCGSKWFCVIKKSGKLRIVHDLQKLNSVTIKDAGLPPDLDSFVEPFAGRACYSVFDLFWGYDARKIHPNSRDPTSFMSPLGLLRITSMPMGFTNAVAEFQNCVVFILQDEIPLTANVFIDDLGIKGPASRHELPGGGYQTIPENPGIRRFIWEQALDVHRIMHRIGHAGAAFSAT